MKMAVYYRFDDGGVTAEDASYSVKPSPAQVQSYYNYYQQASSNYYAKVTEYGENPTAEQQAELDQLRTTMNNAWNTYSAARNANTAPAMIAGALYDGAAMVEVPYASSSGDTYAYLYGDSDNDGIPDFWELIYFGSVEVADGTASSDQDGDGLSDRYEFILGRNPTMLSA